MNCTRIVSLLPLYASADLSAPQLAQVRAHLAHCESCAASADEFSAAREWLRQAAVPEFDEAFYAELRYAVRQELAAQPVRAAWWPLRWQPLAVAAALLLLMIFSLRLFQTKGVSPTDIVNVPASSKLPDKLPDAVPTPPINKLAQTQKTVAPPPRAMRRVIKTESAPEIVAKMEPANVPEPLPGASAAALAPEMLRIEMQTADPNIRIIWLTQNTQRVTAEPLAR